MLRVCRILKADQTCPSNSMSRERAILSVIGWIGLLMVIHLNITDFRLETLCFIVKCCIFINSMLKITSDIVSDCINQSGNKVELNNIRQSPSCTVRS